jgi:hypothetical protein
MASKLTKVEAEANGFTVDTHVYPWFAYKGPRFAPEARALCFTDAEAELASMLSLIREAEFGFGGPWPSNQDIHAVLKKHKWVVEKTANAQN